MRESALTRRLIMDGIKPPHVRSLSDVLAERAALLEMLKRMVSQSRRRGVMAGDPLIADAQALIARCDAPTGRERAA